jgi:hypothetical protein
MRNDEHLTDLVNQSGFPLQMAVEHVVRGLRHDAGEMFSWEVIYREHGWQSPEGDGGFMDLVLQRGAFGPYVLVLECKRVKEAEWLFLVERGAEQPTNDARIWITNRRTGQLQFSGYFDVVAEPRSPVSMFCVLDGGNDSRRSMLERIAAEVCTATEALAEEEQGLPAMAALANKLRMYASVIVTNARLVLSRIDPSDIDLASGKTPTAIHTEAPWLRFRKQFSDKAAVPADAPTFTQAAKAKEKSVFIVNVSHLSEFLSEWNVSDSTLGPLMQPRPAADFEELGRRLG